MAIILEPFFAGFDDFRVAFDTGDLSTEREINIRILSNPFE